MKVVLVLLAVVACASALTEWEEYKEKFDKQYSGREDARRYKIFTQNKALIEENNKKFDEGKSTFKMGINKFADMTTEDTSFLRGYKGRAEKKGATVYQPKKVTVTAADLDWRDEGYVTGVKDQGQCGSCWSFSATGGLEGQNFALTGDLIPLSEQNLMDCDQVSFGCNGGYIDSAFRYVENNGIEAEESYPYEEANGDCRYEAAKSVAVCTGFVDIKSGSEDDLLDALITVGPISVAIDASRISFQLYTSGIYYEDNCSSTELDHGVLVVGYGTDGTDAYWLVKNSWGTSWGEKGYLQMSRNRDNNCGIATQASYPTVE